MTTSTTIWLLFCVLAPMLLGLATLWLPKKAITARTLIALLGPVLSFVILAQHMAKHGVSSITAPLATPVVPWVPLIHMDLSFLADGLGAFFGLLVSGIGVLIVLYARGYFGRDEASLFRFYPTLGFFTTAMMGIVLSDYLLVTVLFWELTSISSFLLIGWDRDDRHAVKLAMQAFFTTALGGMFLMGGVLMLGYATGDDDGLWRWSEVLAQGAARINPTDPMILAAFGMMLFGAATKSAQWPFHYWLPGAMAAPTPVSAYLHSATMVKAGVFLVGRMFPVFAVLHLWGDLIIPLGAFTMLLAALIAINQHDLKRIFAYTTVSQLGLLMCVYGLGSLHADGHPNIEWDITQIANHALYKAPLFIIAGALGHVLSRDLTQLNGAFRKQPWMVITMLLGGYALAAGPGTISFPAKEFFLHAIYEARESIGAWWMVLMAMAAITAVCNVAIFVRLLTTLMGWRGGMKPGVLDSHGRASHGRDAHAPVDAHERGFWAQLIWIPGLVLVLLQYVGGLMPGLWSHWFAPLETNMHAFAQGVPSALHAFMHPSLPLYVSLIAMAAGVAVGLSGLMRGAIVDVHDRIYPALYWLSVTGGGRAFRVIQTGRFRNYLVFVLLAFLGAYVASMILDPAMLNLPASESPLEFLPGVLLGVIICATAILMPIVQSRVVRVIILGSCGFSVVGMYLLYQAPDLALTQLMFEIISVILFVLVLRMLPDLKETDRASGRWWRFTLGTLTGVAIGWLTFVAAQSGAEPRLGEFFARHSYTGTEMTDGRGGGGHNIVNVTLVDFRGFDTLGEITVLSIAALGVFSLFPRHKSLPTQLEFDDRLVRGAAV